MNRAERRAHMLDAKGNIVVRNKRRCIRINTERKREKLNKMLAGLKRLITKNIKKITKKKAPIV